MKKIFCAVLALAAMASCSKEYIVAEDKQAIGFGEVFVDNGTRADYSTDKKVEEFKVYGTVQGKYAVDAPIAYIFDGEKVSRPGGLADYNSETAWICTQTTQYWVPNAKYAFTAVVDGALTADHSKINFTVADGEGNLDLLYATASAETDGNGTPTGDGFTATNSLVKFQFAHLLSKLQFAAPTHTMGANYSVKVTDIKVSNVLDNGIYTVGTGEWAEAAGATTDVVLDFCDAVDTFKSRQILPLNQALTVNIAYDVYFDADLTDDEPGVKIAEVTKTGAITAQDYDKGFVYVITPKITANLIQFTVTGVEGWTTGTGITPVI